MKVRLDRLGDEPHTWQETLALSHADLEHPDVVSLGEVDCRGSVRRTTPGFLLEVTLSYEQTLACTRCLGKITSSHEGRVDWLIMVENEDDHGSEPSEEHELEEDDLGILTLPSPHLDTRPLVVEQMLLNVPMKSLCREDCQGLCLSCGTDLNTGKCECQEATDPRWAALARLKSPVEEHG